ncbi:hypothetical protein HPB128_20g1 [Helicobacter pylori B128]|nr:hypothetical protein HPB128_20g1 [Helicobacter pylori B128]
MWWCVFFLAFVHLPIARFQTQLL